MKGEDYRYFEAERLPRIKHQKLGTLSMVNNGNTCHGSQFFITLGEELDYLDGQHTVFGEVAEGHDILMKFNEAYCDKEGRPYQDIRVYHTVVLEDPFPDPEGTQAVTLHNFCNTVSSTYTFFCQSNYTLCGIMSCKRCCGRVLPRIV